MADDVCHSGSNSQYFRRVTGCRVDVSGQRHGCGIQCAPHERLMRSVPGQRPVDGTRSAALALHRPLRRLALCLDCEACFDIGAPSCPACSADTWIPLAGFFDQRPLSRLPRFHRGLESRQEGPKTVAKQLLIVARDRGKLYGYLRRAFAGNPTVEVVVDRRRVERRRIDQPQAPERRRGDRRLMLDVDNQLRAFGWAVIHLDVVRTVGLRTSPPHTKDGRPRTPSSVSAQG